MPTPTPMTTLLLPEEPEGLVVAVELALDDSIIVLAGETRLVVETDLDVDEDEEDEGDEEDEEEVGDADIVGDAELEVSETAAVEVMFEVCSEVVWDAKLEVVEVVAGVSRSQNCPDQKPPNARCSSVPVALTAWNVKGSELLP